MNAMKICDLHTHVLPGVDDGAPTMEYALQMLRNAAASDVSQLVVTPHCGGLCDNYLTPALRQQFEALRQAAADIPVTLMLGAEVRVDNRLEACLDGQLLPTINGSRYLLTEFAFNTAPEAFEAPLKAILARGYIPLVAHPERYAAVCQSPRRVLSWLEMGCHLQLTAGSMLGAYGKTIQRTAAELLRQDLVACVASDAHGVNVRSNFLLDAWDHLALRYSRQYARCLLYDTPMGICLDETL